MKKPVIFFKTARGDSPVLEYLRSIEASEYGSMMAILSELEEQGRLREPHGKKLTKEIYEVRWGAHRVLYSYVKSGILLLHGFRKKRQKTDPKDISLATKRLKQYTGAIL